MVLADNVYGGDDLDLIVTTMNGNVFCFSTPSPHHPLKVGYKFCYDILFIFSNDSIYSSTVNTLLIGMEIT